MNRAMLLEHLRLARRHVAEGAEHVRRQRDLIARLEFGGHDTTIAQILLAEFEATQQLHVDHLVHLREELTTAGS